MPPFGSNLWRYAVRFGNLLYRVAAAALAGALLVRRARLLHHPIFLPLAAHGIALSVSVVPQFAQRSESHSWLLCCIMGLPVRLRTRATSGF